MEQGKRLQYRSYHAAVDMYSSLLGADFSLPFIAPFVDASSSRFKMTAGVAVGSAPHSRAAAPVTCGAAIEVPDIVLYVELEA